MKKNILILVLALLLGMGNAFAQEQKAAKQNEKISEVILATEMHSCLSDKEFSFFCHIFLMKCSYVHGIILNVSCIVRVSPDTIRFNKENKI